MRQILRTILITGLLFFLFSPHSALGSEAEKAAAVDAAKRWLSTVDGGQFKKCWQQASELIQKNVRQADWSNAIAAARRPLGKVVNRTLKMSQHTTSIPGAPQGEYVIVQYQAAFEQRPAAIEVITVRVDANSKDAQSKEKNWAVAGYWIY